MNCLTLTDHGQEKNTHGYRNIFLSVKNNKTSVNLVPKVNFIMQAIKNRNANQESLHEPFHDVVARFGCE